MFKNQKKSLVAVLLVFAVLMFLPTVLSGCAGGGSAGNNTSTAATTSSSSSSTPSSPTSTVSDPETANKGVLITITKADKSVSAVLVGVSNYIGSAYDIIYAANAPLSIKGSLADSALWAGATISVQNNVNVSKSMIQTAVDAARNNTASDGLFVFSYSGGGGNDGAIGYLIPYYTDGNDMAQIISEDELRTWLNNFPASAKKCVLLEVGGAGEFIDKNAGSNNDYIKAGSIPLKNSNINYNNGQFAKSIVGASNTVVLTASGSGEAIYYVQSVQNGLFSHFVSNGLGATAAAGSADTNANGSVTAEELYAYVYSNVNLNVSDQHPKLYDNYPGEMVIK